MVNGGAKTSFSSGYAESHEMSFRSESPGLTVISNTVRGPFLPQNLSMTLGSVAADLRVYHGKAVPTAKRLWKSSKECLMPR